MTKNEQPPGSQPLVSVLVLSYRHESFIPENITAFWHQTCKNIEIIALDDGSPDNGLEVLNRLAKDSPVPMKVIGQENTGNVAKNFNRLLQNARGKYVYFIAADDIVEQDMIRKAVEIMEAEDSIGYVAYTTLRGFEKDAGGNLRIVRESRLPVLSSADQIMEFDYKNFCCYSLQNTVYRKSILEAVGGFDEDICLEDLSLRIKVNRYLIQHQELTFRVLDDCGVFYRFDHGGNLHKRIHYMIKGVAEAMARYYPDRPLSINWLCYVYQAFEGLPFKEAMKTFFINEKTMETLTRDEILEFVFQKYKEMKNPPLELSWKQKLLRLFFCRLKEGDRREIRILYFIRFNYKKRRKSK